MCAYLRCACQPLTAAWMQVAALCQDATWLRTRLPRHAAWMCVIAACCACAWNSARILREFMRQCSLAEMIIFDNEVLLQMGFALTRRACQASHAAAPWMHSREYAVENQIGIIPSDTAHKRHTNMPACIDIPGHPAHLLRACIPRAHACMHSTPSRSRKYRFRCT